MLQHEHYRVPVTALALWTEDILLSGEGRFLCVYDTRSNTRLASLAALHDQSIHGIIISPRTSHAVLIWGGDQVRLVRIDVRFNIALGKQWRTTDWILDAAFSPDFSKDGEELVSFVSAHNALTVATTAELASNGGSIDVLEPIVPGSNCILYTAHISWLSPSHCLIASGTAFGDVIVWSAFLAREDGKLGGRTQTHYTFCAHEGSVFGVQVLPLQDHVAGTSRMLATCSDDRTIRLWDVSDLKLASPNLSEVQRDTGFGSFSQFDKYAPRCLAKAMGHLSRIWHVRFLQEVRPHEEHGSSVSLMTFGEDATSIVWALKPLESSAPGSLPMVLEKLHAESAHDGKHIWSVAISLKGRIATGGADGAVAIWSKALPAADETEISRSLLVDTRDQFWAYSFVKEDVLIATTHVGKIMKVTLSSASTASASEISPVLDNLKGYSITAAANGIAFIAGKSGPVYAYDHIHRKLKEVAHVEHKVSALFAQASERHGSVDTTDILVGLLGSDNVCLLRLQASAGLSGTPDLAQRYTLALPHDFMVTSFALRTIGNQSLVALGARHGSIAVYRFALHDDATVVNYAALLLDAHDADAVTDLEWSDADCLQSVGRDGTHAIHRLKQDREHVSLNTVHQLTQTFGPKLEGITSHSDSSRLVGFNGKEFVVYDMTAQRKVMSVACGGAHRSWAFHHHADGGTFAWTKSGALYCHTQTELPYRLVNSGGHGRENKAVAISSTEQRIIATGAEDTNIKLSTFHEDYGFQCLQTLRKHNTGIQHLQWSRDGRHLFSSGGFEEFYVWRVTAGVPGVSVGVICESAHPRSGASDLRIMGFTSSTPPSETDTGSNDLVVTMVYSDSTIKRWQYADRVWHLLAAGDYLTACLTEAVHLSDKSLLTTATDGDLAIWRLDDSPTVQWSSRHKAHQNAILSLDTCILEDDSHVVVTGGDDNALSITRIMKGLDKRQTLRIPRAHAAAVTGIAIIRQSPNVIWLVTAGGDQRVKLWRIQVDVDSNGVDAIDVELLHDAFTAVADISNLEIFIDHETRTVGIVLCGVGVDLWRLSMTVDGHDTNSSVQGTKSDTQ